MSDIFLSYSSKDEQRIGVLVEALEGLGWSVFWDHQVPPGLTWEEFIGEELTKAKCVVVAWSKAAVESDYVKEEARVGKGRRVLVPVLLELVEPPFGYGGIQAADLSKWDASPKAPEFAILLVGLRRLLGRPPVEEGAEEEAKKRAKEEEKHRQALAKKAEEEAMRTAEEANRSGEEQDRVGVEAEYPADQDLKPEAETSLLRWLAETRDLSSLLDLKRFGFGYWLTGAYFVASLSTALVWSVVYPVSLDFGLSYVLSQIPVSLTLAIVFTLVCSLRLRMWQRVLAWGGFAVLMYYVPDLARGLRDSEMLFNPRIAADIFFAAVLFMAAFLLVVSKLGVRWLALSMVLATVQLLWSLVYLIFGYTDLMTVLLRATSGFLYGSLIFVGLYLEGRNRLST